MTKPAKPDGHPRSRSMRNELQLIRDIYHHNSKARKEYVRKIWRLSPQERARDRGASFPSLVDIYMHILDDHRFWFLKVYARTPFEEYPLGARYTLADATRETRRVDRLVAGVLRDLTPKDLDRKILHPVDREYVTVRTMLVNLIKGELQHEGELNALLWQSDVDPPPFRSFGERTEARVNHRRRSRS
jgi:uncharacterized damage-inducible protein DinB